MLTIGVALFATFSGFLANTFLSASRKKRAPAAEAPGDKATLRDVERLLEEQERTAAVLRVRISELDAQA